MELRTIGELDSMAAKTETINKVLTDNGEGKG